MESRVVAAPLPQLSLPERLFQCMHTPILQLRMVVPLLVRLMRAPRLGTARAATLTLKTLLE